MGAWLLWVHGYYWCMVTMGAWLLWVHGYYWCMVTIGTWLLLVQGSTKQLSSGYRTVKNFDSKKVWQIPSFKRFGEKTFKLCKGKDKL